MKRETLYRQDAITVWPFNAAPEEFRVLSPHGGDEDWCAYVPEPIVKNAGTGGEDISLVYPWIERLGCCDTSCHRLPDGCQVFIGAHA